MVRSRFDFVLEAVSALHELRFTLDRKKGLQYKKYNPIMIQSQPVTPIQKSETQEYFSKAVTNPFDGRIFVQDIKVSVEITESSLRDQLYKKMNPLLEHVLPKAMHNRFDSAIDRCIPSLLPASGRADMTVCGRNSCDHVWLTWMTCIATES